MEKKKNYVHIIFIIVLAGLFALSSVLLALLGVNVYRTSSTGTNGQDLDTASLYFAQKVRGCEDKSAIRSENLDADVPALVMGSREGGKDFETWFYVHDGSLKEATVLEGRDVSTEDGREIMEMKSIDFEIVDGDLLQISMTGADGAETSLNLHLAGGDAND